ncbi:HDIG domain-containing protein [Gracilibacillus ureilyticus]|uniref:HDIG domain-containing protein n=1 Tax=Gracilibacillus ureilyticus TaxID=531814 RepID=A0A1H9S0Y1_9BACI|nr:HD-GYP domain-containing protein [Gracilibacillus ureilyticus]SER78647.1 HDIG domain-containing protein [Gracilibacillus ureilyticus]
MRLVSTMLLQDGVELAKPIYDNSGRILVQRNVKLTSTMVRRLKTSGITYVYIRDKYTEDILVTPAIPDEERMEAVNKIKKSFQSIKKEDIKKGSHLLDKSSEQLNDVVKGLVENLLDQDEVMHYLSDLLIVDNYVFHHSVNVTIYTLALARQLKFNRKEMQVIGLGALLHDIGKIYIPPEILNKDSKLNDTEFKIIKAHTEYGFELLRKSLTLPLLAAHCAFQHHERLDGSGYPRGLVSDNIHPYAKILGIADVFDAVTSNRVYRAAMLPHKGLEILSSGAGRQFDANLVNLFKKTVSIYPNGITVHLNDGRTGVVTKQNVHSHDRPIVRVLQEDNHPVQPYDLDLSIDPDALIIGADNAQ